jgi:hypothetical protein
MLFPLIAGSTWAQTATGVVETTGEGADLPSVRLVGVDQVANLVAFTTGECACLASDRLVGVGSASHCGGGYER